jgi:hypothetical protein
VFGCRWGWRGAVSEWNICPRCGTAPLLQIGRSEPLVSTRFPPERSVPLRSREHRWPRKQQQLPQISPASEAATAASNQAGLECRRPGLASASVDVLSTAAPTPFLYFPANNLPPPAPVCVVQVACTHVTTRAGIAPPPNSDADGQLHAKLNRSLSVSLVRNASVCPSLSSVESLAVP